MPEECIASQSEVIGAVFLEDSPCADCCHAAVLMSKSWFVPSNGDVAVGDVLTMHLQTHEQYASASVMKVRAPPQHTDCPPTRWP